MQAIYETGSKLTHDVKNILQSTQMMTQIINDTDTEMREIIDVLKKQMPLLTQRLNTTLEKLRAPENYSIGNPATAGFHASLVESITAALCWQTYRVFF